MRPLSFIRAHSVNRRTVLMQGIIAVFLAYAFLATVFDPYRAVSPGLDSSWMYALNRLPGTSYIFGKDVTFTYGPLGFLLNPLDVGWCLVGAIWFWAAFQFALFALASYGLWRQRGRLLVFSTAYMLLIGLGIWQEQRILLLIGALVVLSLRDSKWAGVFAAAAGLLSVAGLQMKWSIGISGFSMLFVSWIILLTSSIAAARTKVVLGMSGILVALLASLAFFHSPLSMWNWLALSAQFTSGYSSAMSLQGPFPVKALAAVAATCVAILYGVLSHSARPVLVVFIGPLLFSFKEGFVRQGGQSLAFFAVVAMIPALLLLAPALSRADVRKATGAFTLTFLIAVVYATHYDCFPAFRWNEWGTYLSLQKASGIIGQTIDLQTTRASLRNAAALSLPSDVLPAEWEALIAKTPYRTSMVPWEMSIAAANSFNWQPLPVLQLYAAYTPVLDSAVAEQIRKGGADFLIATHESIDGRNLILDTPQTWRAILDNYSLKASDLVQRRALLVRRNPVGETLRDKSSGRAASDEWVAVPSSTHLLYSALDLRYTTLGSMAALSYQVPPVFIDLIRNSGRQERYRIMPQNVDAGILINYLPDNQAELEQLFRDQADDPVIKFRVLLPGGLTYFQPRYEWRLRESSRVIHQAAYIAQPPAISSFSPSKGKGRATTLLLAAQDLNGAQAIQFVQILINHTLTGERACYISYDVAENRVWLLADKGSGPAGVGRPGEAITLTNKQCSVSLAGAVSAQEGESLKLSLPVIFAGGFDGPLNMYTYTVDRRAGHSEWDLRGIWNAP